MPTKQKNSQPGHSISRYVPFVLLCLSLIAALLLRTGAIALQDSPESIFLNKSTPQLINPDGYYYLNIAKEIRDKTYSDKDNKRIYPQGIVRSSRPPLLATLIAAFANITSLSIDWIGVLFPVFASLLLAIPLYLFGLKLGEPGLAAIGVFFGLTAPAYAGRTALGLLDTDCLNIFFPLMIAYSFYAFAINSKRIRYLWLLTGLILFSLFSWWWDMAPAVVASFTIGPLLLAFVFFYKSSHKKVRLFMLLAGVGVLSALTFSEPSYLPDLTKGLIGKLSYITEKPSQQSLFPLTSLSNSEQQSLPLLTIAAAICKPYFLFFAGIAGLLWMLLKRPTIFFFLLPVILVGGLSLYASRFMIFLVPTISLGIVFILSRLQKTIQYKTAFFLSCALLTILSGWQNLANPPIHKPVFSNRIINGMELINNLTPENSVIYSWWDDGHLLIYYGQRPTLADGAYHGGQRISYLAFPFVTDSYQLAANYIRFYSTHGLPGIHRFMRESKQDQKKGFTLLQTILNLGPVQSLKIIAEQLEGSSDSDLTTEQWRNFLFPENGPEVYLFLNNRHFKPNLQRAIYWNGTWDTEKRSGIKTIPTIIIANVEIGDNGEIDGKNLEINYKEGLLNFPQLFNSPLPLGSIGLDRGALPVKTGNYSTTDNDRIVPAGFRNSHITGKLPYLNAKTGRYNLEVLPTRRKLLLQDDKIAKMLSQQLFFHSDSISTPYFSLIAEDPDHFQIWKVQGD